ncbi:MAG TPA: hypothetical protein VGF67_09355 [Ktedonobacteraceae bacterium]
MRGGQPLDNDGRRVRKSAVPGQRREAEQSRPLPLPALTHLLAGHSTPLMRRLHRERCSSSPFVAHVAKAYLARTGLLLYPGSRQNEILERLARHIE